MYIGFTRSTTSAHDLVIRSNIYTRSRRSIGISFLFPIVFLSLERFSWYFLCNAIASIAKRRSGFVKASIDFSARSLKFWTTSKIFFKCWSGKDELYIKSASSTIVSPAFSKRFAATL